MNMHIVRLAAAALVAALSLTACGEGESPSPAASTPAATAPTATTPASDFDRALWPDPATATAQDGPLDVARSFLERFVGVENPALGEFQQGDSRSGEVPVLRRREDGSVLDKVIAWIAVRQLDGVRWFVIVAGSDEVKLSSPRAGENEVMPTISSPVKVEGRGLGFEGNILVRVHAAFDPKPIARGTRAGRVDNDRAVLHRA